MLVQVSLPSALGLGPVSPSFLAPITRGLAASIDLLRVKRQLEEAVANRADPLHLVGRRGIHEPPRSSSPTRPGNS